MTSVPSPNFARFLLGATVPRALGLPALGEAYGRWFNRISHHYHTDSLDVWRARLDAAGIANARLNTPDQVWDHEQLRARRRWREVESPAGAIPALLPPASFSGIEPRMDPIPRIGEHTQRILAELGYTVDEIGALKASGAV